MKRRVLSILSRAVLYTPFAAAQNTRQGNVRETLHGVTVSDPYRCLEDQDSVETRAWINQQHDYTHKPVDSWSGRERLETRGFRSMARSLRSSRFGTPRKTELKRRCFCS
ncbi:MAG TPA: hypothetical protein VIX37_20840, partial [Candidatus Sulfotelmatobacter sp.]